MSSSSIRHGVRFPDSGPAADDDVESATVSVVAPAGAATSVHSMGANMETSARFVEHHAFVPGPENGLAPPLEGAHLFSTETGERV